MQNRPAVICLTPIKNEAWILPRFLRCASLWADHIIIADQGSDDGSREIAQSFPKVKLIDNSSTGLDEGYRVKLLLDAARTIPGSRLLISLDADEILTANFLTSPEWTTALQAVPGTVIRFKMPVINSDLGTYWMVSWGLPLGFVDDGRPFTGKAIHAPRLPVTGPSPTLLLNDVRAMHYVGADSARWDSKHRWYQCWERLNRPQRRPVENYRFYHRKDVTPASEIKPIPRDKWFSGYEDHGIDMTSVNREATFRWDAEVLELFQQHGTERFRREAIWDVDWNSIYKQIHGKDPPLPLNDPRSTFERRVHRWLAYSQHHFSYYPARSSILSLWSTKLVENLLRPFGW